MYSLESNELDFLNTESPPDLRKTVIYARGAFDETTQINVRLMSHLCLSLIAVAGRLSEQIVCEMKMFNPLRRK